MTTLLLQHYCKAVHRNVKYTKTFYFLQKDSHQLAIKINNTRFLLSSDFQGNSTRYQYSQSNETLLKKRYIIKRSTIYKKKNVSLPPRKSYPKWLLNIKISEREVKEELLVSFVHLAQMNKGTHESIATSTRFGAVTKGDETIGARNFPAGLAFNRGSAPLDRLRRVPGA